MHFPRVIILLLAGAFNLFQIQGQHVFRFEHIGTEQGLSQNTGSSILFDSKGFMWIGTMNGLNRYDGYEFKIFKGQSGNTRNFTNNRVTKLWEDKKGFIWAETYDGYYHFFNPRTELFSSIPNYEENMANNFRINQFVQYSDDIIFLGSSNAGLFYLQYDRDRQTYIISRFPDKGNQPLSNNNIRFIHADSQKNIWIGSDKGINLLRAADIKNRHIRFQHQFVNATFTSVSENKRSIWFGTEEMGIITYDKASAKYNPVNSDNQPVFPDKPITFLYYTASGIQITGFAGGDVMVSDANGYKWTKIPFHGKALNAVYEDKSKQLWLMALEFGVTRLDPATLHTTYYTLTPLEIKHLTDLERPQFYEDCHNNLWIGLHGGGLALFHRKADQFEFFRNDPGDPNSISSNIIHSIAEDHAGQMWLGTGQFLGGIEKVILENPAFSHHLVETGKKDMLDNVVRAIMEDRNRHVWVATKAGRIHIYDKNLQKIITLDSLPGAGRESVRNNTYSFFHDRNGYIWIGTKGDGLSVTTKPVTGDNGYRQARFRRFKNVPGDTTSPGNNNIYSICQDHADNIWIGTYGNGLNMVRHPYDARPVFIRINQQNSNLSSNLVRYILTDRSGNLWVATTHGLNVMYRQDIEKGNFRFTHFFKNPSGREGLSYNDVVQIFEDSKGRLWLGTFGGGADMLQFNAGGDVSFKHFTSENGISNDVVFGILEDENGKIWLSTENGLTRIDPESESAAIYNTFNGLNFNNFSENACFARKDHSLCFGGYLGFEVVYPDKLVPETSRPGIELTSFQLFNKEVPVNQTGSPLNKNISFTDEITLRYNQSSFSINFSALDLLDPGKINYLYKLENFEKEWNSVGNQHKATYTNLSPGRYIFKVKSLKSNNPSASEERMLRIHIRPPWWKTFPAYLSYLVLISFIAVSIYKTIARLNRYRNELLVEKKVNELKLQFFTNISHEIRTPLTLIIGPIEDILSTHGITQRNRTLMEIIHKNAKRMLHLTSQLLDFRKVQNNKMVLKISQVDLVSFARDVYESFIPLSKHKDLTYTFQSDAGSLMIFADPSKLDSIIYNIISNAIKFTGQGKRVSVELISRDKDFVDISVSDQGPGIPQKNLSDIFTRYTILSNRDFSGTGIGLSLSYELTRLHKGDILISSTEGEGSIFTIRLPKGKWDYGEMAEYSYNPDNAKRENQEVSENSPEMDNPETETATQKKQLLLIVEDNPEIQNYISQALRESFTCVGAKNGLEGLHIATTMNPDIIITDIMMPEMNGIEMTHQIKEDFNTCHIPVVMLTSKAGMRDQIAGIETGAEAYITKPFHMDYLKAVVSNLLNQRQKIMARFAGIRTISPEPLNVASRDEAFLTKVVAYIEENYETDFQIDVLAEHCCVGRTVFYNKIKGLTGTGPLEFVRTIKLKIAARLLEKGYNVTEVAYKTGFSDVKYFSRQYKAQFGIPPSKQKVQ